MGIWTGMSWLSQPSLSPSSFSPNALSHANQGLSSYQSGHGVKEQFNSVSLQGGFICVNNMLALFFMYLCIDRFTANPSEADLPVT